MHGEGQACSTGEKWLGEIARGGGRPCRCQFFET
jgi:hypothetical protein